MKRWRRAAAAAAMAVLGGALASPAHAQAAPDASASARSAESAAAASAPTAGYAERYGQLCAACHGANGRSDMAGTPVLAGQHSLYAITQLFLLREGRRNNPAMVAVAKTMTDADLRGFSAFIGTLPPVPPPAPPAAPDPARMGQGLALAQQYKCVFCHGAALDGGQGVPRIGGQKEDYVRAALHGYKTGDRPGYTRAMSESLSQVPAEDLDLLAFYVANFRSP